MMRRPRMRARGLALTLLLALSPGAAHAADPPLASGRDPGGTAVAVIGRGFDYRRAELARLLARDGEGEAIAWDAVDNDHRPFAATHDDTATALAAGARGSVRIVPIRAALDEPASLAKAVAFAAATPARIVLVSLDAGTRDRLAVMSAAARRFEAVLMVVSLPTPTADEREAANAAGNLVLLDSSTGRDAAAHAVARVLGCDQGSLAGTTGTDQKRAFLDRLDAPPADCQPEAAKAD